MDLKNLQNLLFSFTLVINPLVFNNSCTTENPPSLSERYCDGKDDNDNGLIDENLSQTVPCGFNGRGTQEQICLNGQYINQGNCFDSDRCKLGDRKEFYTSPAYIENNQCKSQLEVCVDTHPESSRPIAKWSVVEEEISVGSKICDLNGYFCSAGRTCDSRKCQGEECCYTVGKDCQPLFPLTGECQTCSTREDIQLNLHKLEEPREISLCENFDETGIEKCAALIKEKEPYATTTASLNQRHFTFTNTPPVFIQYPPEHLIFLHIIPLIAQWLLIFGKNMVIRSKCLLPRPFLLVEYLTSFVVLNKLFKNQNIQTTFHKRYKTVFF